jgi:hypothetical protein
MSKYCTTFSDYCTTVRLPRRQKTYDTRFAGDALLPRGERLGLV